MMKRLFFAAVGLGAGVAVGIYLVHKVEQTQRNLAPDVLARRAGAGIESFGDRVRDALDAGRAAAAEKEAELRAVYGVRGQSMPAAAAEPSTPGAP